MTIEKLKLEFFDFYQCREFALIFYHDAEDNKIIFKIYKDNISLENHYKIIDKIKELELDKNEEIKFLIIYQDNEDNKHILSFEEYVEEIKRTYNKGDEINNENQ